MFSWVAVTQTLCQQGKHSLLFRNPEVLCHRVYCTCISHPFNFQSFESNICLVLKAVRVFRINIFIMLPVGFYLYLKAEHLKHLRSVQHNQLSLWTIIVKKLCIRFLRKQMCQCAETGSCYVRLKCDQFQNCTSLFYSKTSAFKGKKIALFPLAVKYTFRGQMSILEQICFLIL